MTIELPSVIIFIVSRFSEFVIRTRIHPTRGLIIIAVRAMCIELYVFPCAYRNKWMLHLLIFFPIVFFLEMVLIGKSVITGFMTILVVITILNASLHSILLDTLFDRYWLVHTMYEYISWITLAETCYFHYVLLK